jgi:hypothetical protein
LLDQAAFLAAKQKRRFRFKNPLFSVDSSTIDLCLSLYDWAKFRRTKGAVKLHLMLNHQGSLSNLAAMLRFNLLTYRDLWVWLDRPYQTPALGPPDGQLLLFG